MASTPKGPGKRLIVCCDGTWQDSVGSPQTPTNVTRICRCIKSEGFDPIGQKNIPQVTYYQSGVGSTGSGPSLMGHLLGGLTGQGISENIREAYVFLCLNYNPGDEIFLIGFSRGAFTARSISSLIRAIGLLNRKGLVYLYQITQDWEHQEIPGWKGPYPPWPNQPNHDVNSEEYRRELLAQELTTFDTPIKAVGVFDTVGSLGIPAIGILPRIFMRKLSFVNTKVEPIIENAFQALGLDEKRKPYSPTIWEVPDGQENPKVLKQCWFPGVHSDIGGGYDDQELGNLTLAWMLHQLEGMLEFDRSYILEQQSVTIKAVHESGQPLRDWGLGRIHNSFKPLFWLTGKAVRSPCNYYEVKQRWFPALVGVVGFAATKRRLHNTHQMVHASVRVRLGCNGPGYNDEGVWKPDSLEGWRWNATVSEDDTGNHQITKVRWSKQTGDKDEPVLYMDEDELGDLEKILLKNWSPKVYHSLPSLTPDPPPGHHRKSVTLPKDRAESVAYPIDNASTDKLVLGTKAQPMALDRAISTTL